MAKQSKGKDAVRSIDTASTTIAASPSRPASKPNHKRPGSSTSAPTSQQARKKQRIEKPQSSSSLPLSSLPGASKIKASIRQTKRLLAKPNLAPGTKIEAERRLKSLQADLEAASRKQIEKARASRYHKVKFVERQKLVRRIARCKRNLARLDSAKVEPDSESDSNSNSDSEGEGGSDDDVGQEQRVKESKMNKDELLELLKCLREWLQYVVQYPADLRYVALFPNTREGPSPPDATEKDKSRQKAYQHLERVKKAMQTGELSNEPEVELSNHDRPRTKLVKSNSHLNSTNVNNKATTKEKEAKHNRANKTSHHPNSNRDKDEHEEQVGGVKDDDFFAQDSDDDQ